MRSLVPLVSWRALPRALGAFFALSLALVPGAVLACDGAPRPPAQERALPAAEQPSGRPAPQHVRTDIGFRSRRQFDEHFAKHGREFGRVTQQEYLREAQTLRDAPVGGNVEELARPDGTVSRYDRASGAFIAFDSDNTIRTFFKPNNGEAYFRRQAARSH